MVPCGQDGGTNQMESSISNREGIKIFEPGYFAGRWMRAISQAAEEPGMHHVVVEARAAK
jgi:hypothetical protein